MTKVSLILANDYSFLYCDYPLGLSSRHRHIHRNLRKAKAILHARPFIINLNTVDTGGGWCWESWLTLLHQAPHPYCLIKEQGHVLPEPSRYCTHTCSNCSCSLSICLSAFTLLPDWNLHLLISVGSLPALRSQQVAHPSLGLCLKISRICGESTSLPSRLCVERKISVRSLELGRKNVWIVSCRFLHESIKQTNQNQAKKTNKPFFTQWR